MSYILRKVGNATNIAVNQYEADTELDMKDINVQEAPMGSRCYVINTGVWYVLNDKGEWKVVPKKGGGGGGQGAALPGMGEVTKGMYLTNDGSNAEWARIESNLFLIHLIQGEPDSYGNPTYTVDKTFAEIKTAYDAGKKVELIPPVDDESFIMAVGSTPFEVAIVSPARIDFRNICASPAGVNLPSLAFGGVPLGDVYVVILPDEKVVVNFPFYIDGDTGMPVWNTIQKLPQQYIVIVTAGTDGTLSANNTLDQLNRVGQAYSFTTDVIGGASINANYNGKLYYMSGGTDTSLTFTATTENGLETLTVSNDGEEGSADVWTHEVVPLGGNDLFMVTMTLKAGDVYEIDKTFSEIKAATNAGKVVVAVKYYSFTKEFYLLTDILDVPTRDTKRLTFTGVSSTIGFYADDHNDNPRYSDEFSSRGTLVRSNSWHQDYIPPVPVTTTDNGKFLRVVDGQWAAAEITNANGVNF